MSAGDLPSILETLPENRIAFLERQNIARRLGEQSSGYRQLVERLVSGAENRVIERMLIYRLRKAIKNRLKPDASELFLNGLRSDYHSGRKNTYTLLSSSKQEQTETALISTYAPYVTHRGRNTPPSLLYIPGGGFILPPTRKQRAVAQDLARLTGCRLHIANHRLAPEDPFPAAVEDLCTAFHKLVNTENPPEKIIVGADTAGASILMGAMMRLRDENVQLPAGLMLFSPWCDLSLSGWSYISQSVLPTSPFRMETAAFCARLYLADTQANHPEASAIFGSLKNFPPMMIHTSTFDLHFDDAVKLTEIGHENGCQMQLHYWESPRHHLERLNKRDSEKAFRRASEFVSSCIGSA